MQMHHSGMSAFLYGCHMRGSEVIFAEMHDRVAWWVFGHG